MLSNYIYENTKNEILKDFINENEVNEILLYYKKYLDRIYEATIKDEQEYEKFKDKFLKYEINKWNDISKEMKQSLLLEDEILNRIGFLSDMGLKYALAKNKGLDINISLEKAQEYIKEMKQLVDKVRKFNKNLARTYCSEGVLDFMYATGLTNKTSLRLGRMRG